MFWSVLLWLPIDSLLTALFLPFFLIVFGPVLFYRQLVKVYAKCIHPDYVMASSFDHAVSHDVFHARKHKADLSFISGMMANVFGNIDIRSVRERWKMVLLEAKNNRGQFLHPRLSYSTVLFGGYLFFKPIVVDLEKSIHEMGLEDGETLDEFKCRFLHRTIPPDSPMWEIVVLKIKEDSYMLTRFHHSIVDGYSQMYAMNVFFGDSQDFGGIPRNPLHHGLLGMLLTGVQTVRLVIAQVIWNLKAKSSIPDECGKPRPDKVLMADTNISYDDLKYIVRNTKTTFLALNFTIYAGVLRRISNKIYTRGDTVAIITASPWPDHPIKNGQFSNHFACICQIVPIGEKDPLIRLLETDGAIRATYDMGMDRIGRWVLMQILATLPLELTRRLQNFAETFGGLKCMNATLVSFKHGFRKLDGLPLISMSTLIGRCSTNLPFGQAMVVENGKCFITFVASTNVVKTQAKLNEIMPYFQEEVKALVDRIKMKEEHI